MIEVIHEFETVEGQPVRVTLRNTMLQDIRFNVMLTKFADEEQHPGDFIARFNFCYFAARVVSVEGIDWRPVDEDADEDRFRANYYALAGLLDNDTFTDCAQAVGRLKGRVDPVEKPDSALTPDEEADPN